MKLFELAEDEIDTGYYDPAEDRFERRSLGDTRKPVLTLRKLNRLKKMRALHTLDDMKRQDLLGVMYGIPEDDAGGGGFGGF